MAVNPKNPQFDPRMRSIPALGVAAKKDSGFWRGSIYREEKTVTGGYLTLDFLFNPSTISISHSLGYNLSAADRSTDGNVIGAQGIGTLQFDLLFDRTYEMYGASPNFYDEAATKGVLADVEALYNITGAYDVTAKGAQQKSLQAMQPNACNFFFGGSSSGAGLLANNTLSYYGTVTSLTVTYTHFSREMIPQRCALSLSVDLSTKVN
ncbi:hypothetical protein ACFZCP_14635 [Streptomyces sp. NPDC007971]|uniref:CIS tube protein n=1 Tax=Streptomyces sp. NPDC007971 TaxID=3364799 RepID=UPI0036E2C1CA